MHLVEDRPSKNVSSPGSLPIDLAIPALFVTRDRSGLFSLQPLNINSGSLTNAHASVPEVRRPMSSEAENEASTSHLGMN